MRLSRKHTPKWLVFLVLPVVLLVFFKPISTWRGPFWAYGNYDPEYAYLFNSLAVLELKVPWHRDHPGTTLQSLGAITARVMHPTLSRQEIVENVAANPERHLKAFALVLLLICAGVIGWSGALVAGAMGNVWCGILFQLVPFFSFTSWSFNGRFTPDPLVLALGMFVPAAAIGISGRRRPVVFGIAVAAAIVTKLTAIPLIVFPALLLFKKRQEHFKFAAALGAGFLVCGIPLLFRWKESIAYMLAFPGRVSYGKNEGQIIDPLHWAARAGTLIVHNPLLPLGFAAGLYLIYDGVRKRRGDPIVLTALFALCGQVLMVAGNSVPRYLLPAYGTVALLTVLALQKTLNEARIKWAPLAAMIAGAALAASAPFSMVTDHELIARRAAARQLLESNIAKYHCVPVYASPSNSLPFALFFGNNFAGGIFADALEKVYPGTYLYSGVPERFDDFYDKPVYRRATCIQGKAGMANIAGFNEIPSGDGEDSLYLSRIGK